MCMFTLTVSTAESKNIKEAMADSAWIEAMQEELHQLDKLQVWELVDKPLQDKYMLRKTGVLIRGSFALTVARLEAVFGFSSQIPANTSPFPIYQNGRTNDIS
ncbi:hypothetical protein Tco_0427554 [Tanacetum coccineum]